LNLAEKKVQVEDIKKLFEGCTAVFLVNNRGLKAGDIAGLRSQIKKNGGEIKVMKNTLLKLAIKGSQYEANLGDFLSGPTAVTFSRQDPAGVAKVLVGLVDDNKPLEIKSGLLGAIRISVADIKKLAKLPGKKELIGRTVRTIAAPLSNFMGVLSAVPRDFLGVLVAIKDKKATAK
jgi:large subunit ribosomal protein L10